MQRELKFRAWDKATSRMLETGFNLIGEVTAFDIISQKLMEQPLGKTTLQRIGDVIVTQYIGIKDKNGKDIYEGDVVIVSNGEDDYYGIVEASLYHGLSIKGIGQVLFRGKNNQELQPSLRGAWYVKRFSNHEVIGNIYQHPHLITVPATG